MQAVVAEQAIPSVWPCGELISESGLGCRFDRFEIGDRHHRRVLAHDHRERVVEAEVRAPVKAAFRVGVDERCIRLMQDCHQCRAGVLDVCIERSRCDCGVAHERAAEVQAAIGFASG